MKSNCKQNFVGFICYPPPCITCCKGGYSITAMCVCFSLMGKILKKKPCTHPLPNVYLFGILNYMMHFPQQCFRLGVDAPLFSAFVRKYNQTFSIKTTNKRTTYQAYGMSTKV